jgi:hypothetical protein
MPCVSEPKVIADEHKWESLFLLGRKIMLTLPLLAWKTDCW